MTSSTPEEWLGIDVEGVKMDEDAITYARKHLDYIECEELRLAMCLSSSLSQPTSHQQCV